VLELSPEAVILTTLQARLSFFKTFYQQRRMQLFIVPSAKAEEGAAAPVLIDDLHKTFKEWAIKEDGVVLQLRDPGKKGASYA
jgi:hypothetical protein